MKSSVKKPHASTIEKMFGENVFGLKTMQKYLKPKTYAELSATVKNRQPLEPAIADEVAGAMLKWAMEKGATHFTHWFQPLTGGTAEKHDSFISPDFQGSVEMKFSGKELIQGEPDASSFPSGGLRATFEARGYTVWDPTSPAFIKEADHTSVLCIPTAFYSYHGEALDKKTPLLRSIDALSAQINRMSKLFGVKSKGIRPYSTLGIEQEYFLIDKEYYAQRIDLVQTGRTLFGRRPAKHQQMEDHYFGAIKTRVLLCMEDIDRELWRQGIPAKTRHNEVAPAQFEIAPVFEELNIAVDHNMMVMETLRQVAEHHGFVCLLHEKPFAGINGSGKHNNWAVVGPDGKNWLNPGDTPHENAVFITMVCALMKAIDTNAGLLRAGVATAGNDHRLGANEAPPAIISIFLGDQLTDIIEQVEKGGATSSKEKGILEVGVSSLPKLAKDVSDRNRTSPFAFTGNKFEFRAVGSNQSCAGPNIMLNVIVTAALDEICTDIEKAVAAGKEFNAALQSVLQKTVKKHKRIIFNGDNYTEEWHREAEKRGLPNLKTTPESLEETIKDSAIKLFGAYNVLSRTELTSRYEIYKEQYEKTVKFETGVALEMARTLLIPAAIRYQEELAQTVVALKNAGRQAGQTGVMLETVSQLVDQACAETKGLEEAYGGHSLQAMLHGMRSLRGVIDSLEEIVPRDLWPVPSYAEMLFMY